MAEQRIRQRGGFTEVLDERGKVTRKWANNPDAAPIKLRKATRDQTLCWLAHAMFGAMSTTAPVTITYLNGAVLEGRVVMVFKDVPLDGEKKGSVLRFQLDGGRDVILNDVKEVA